MNNSSNNRILEFSSYNNEESEAFQKPDDHLVKFEKFKPKQVIDKDKDNNTLNKAEHNVKSMLSNLLNDIENEEICENCGKNEYFLNAIEAAKKSKNEDNSLFTNRSEMSNILMKNAQIKDSNNFNKLESESNNYEKKFSPLFRALSSTKKIKIKNKVANIDSGQFTKQNSNQTKKSAFNKKKFVRKSSTQKNISIMERKLKDIEDKITTVFPQQQANQFSLVKKNTFKHINSKFISQDSDNIANINDNQNNNKNKNKVYSSKSKPLLLFNQKINLRRKGSTPKDKLKKHLKKSNTKINIKNKINFTSVRNSKDMIVHDFELNSPNKLINNNNNLGLNLHVNNSINSSMLNSSNLDMSLDNSRNAFLNNNDKNAQIINIDNIKNYNYKDKYKGKLSGETAGGSVKLPQYFRGRTSLDIKNKKFIAGHNNNYDSKLSLNAVAKRGSVGKKTFIQSIDEIKKLLKQSLIIAPDNLNRLLTKDKFTSRSLKDSMGKRSIKNGKTKISLSGTGISDKNNKIFETSSKITKIKISNTLDEISKNINKEINYQTPKKQANILTDSKTNVYSKRNTKDNINLDNNSGISCTQNVTKKNKSKLENANTEENEDSNVDKEESEELYRKKIFHERYRILIQKGNVYDSLDDEEIEDEEPNDFYLAPDSYFIIIFDSLLFILTMHSLFMAPIYITTLKKFCRDYKYDLNETLIFITEIWFILDLIQNFFRAYYNFDEQLIRRTWPIFFHYLGSWFLFDLISAIPFFTIFKLRENSCENEHFLNTLNFKFDTKLNKLHYLLIINKFIKAFKFFNQNQLIKIISSSLAKSDYFNDFTKTLLEIIITFSAIHQVACSYVFIGRNSYPNWIMNSNLLEASFYKVYLISIYYLLVTITTVGYGDILNASLKEKIFSLFLLAVGSTAYSWIISSVSNYIKKINEKDADYDNRVNILDEIKLTNPNLPYSLYDSIIRHLRYKKYHEKKDKNLIFECLPVGLKNNLVFEMYKPIINNFIFFKNFENSDFIVRVVLAFKPIMAIKNDILVKEGDIMEDIIFVKRGILVLELPINLDDQEGNIDLYLNGDLFNPQRNSISSLAYDPRYSFVKSSSNSQKTLVNQNSNHRNSRLETIKENESFYSTSINNTKSTNGKIQQKRNSAFSSFHSHIGPAYDFTKYFKTQKSEKEVEPPKVNKMRYLKVVSLRENEHFGEVMMFLELRCPLRLRVRVKKAELFFLKKMDAVQIFSSYPNIWTRINKKSLFNMEQIKKLVKKIVSLYCSIKGINQGGALHNGSIIQEKRRKKFGTMVQNSTIKKMNSFRLSYNNSNKKYRKSLSTKKLSFCNKYNDYFNIESNKLISQKRDSDIKQSDTNISDKDDNILPNIVKNNDLMKEKNLNFYSTKISQKIKENIEKHSFNKISENLKTTIHNDSNKLKLKLKKMNSKLRNNKRYDSVKIEKFNKNSFLNMTTLIQPSNLTKIFPKINECNSQDNNVNEYENMKVNNNVNEKVNLKTVNNINEQAELKAKKESDDICSSKSSIDSKEKEEIKEKKISLSRNNSKKDSVFFGKEKTNLGNNKNLISENINEDGFMEKEYSFDNVNISKIKSKIDLNKVNMNYSKITSNNYDKSFKSKGIFNFSSNMISKNQISTINSNVDNNNHINFSKKIFDFEHSNDNSPCELFHSNNIITTKNNNLISETNNNIKSNRSKNENIYDKSKSLTERLEPNNSVNNNSNFISNSASLDNDLTPFRFNEINDEIYPNEEFIIERNEEDLKKKKVNLNIYNYYLNNEMINNFNKKDSINSETTREDYENFRKLFETYIKEKEESKKEKEEKEKMEQLTKEREKYHLKLIQELRKSDMRKNRVFDDNMLSTSDSDSFEINRAYDNLNFISKGKYSENKNDIQKKVKNLIEEEINNNRRSSFKDSSVSNKIGNLKFKDSESIKNNNNSLNTNASGNHKTTSGRNKSNNEGNVLVKKNITKLNSTSMPKKSDNQQITLRNRMSVSGTVSTIFSKNFKRKMIKKRSGKCRGSLQLKSPSENSNSSESIDRKKTKKSSVKHTKDSLIKISAHRLKNTNNNFNSLTPMNIRTSFSPFKKMSTIVSKGCSESSKGNLNNDKGIKDYVRKNTKYSTERKSTIKSNKKFGSLVLNSLNKSTKKRRKADMLNLMNVNIQKSTQNLNNPEEFYTSYFQNILQKDMAERKSFVRRLSLQSDVFSSKVINKKINRGNIHRNETVFINSNKK